MSATKQHGPPPEKERPANVGTKAERNLENQCSTTDITDFAKAKVVASKKTLYDRALVLFCGIPRKSFSEEALDNVVERLFNLRTGRNADLYKSREERGVHWLDAPYSSNLKRPMREKIVVELHELLDDTKIEELEAEDAVYEALIKAGRWHRSGARKVVQ